MIEERRQDIGEHLEDSDDEDAHNHPLPYLLRQRRFHDLPEEQAERSNDDHHNDGRPDCKAFAECPFVHCPISPPSSAQPPTALSYTHSYPSSRSQSTGRGRWPPCGRGLK